MAIVRTIRVTSGAIITLPYDCIAVIENESSATVTASVRMSLGDSTMVTAAEASQFLKSDVSKFNSATPSNAFFSIGTINATSAMTYDQKLHGGSQLQLTGGNCSVTMISVVG